MSKMKVLWHINLSLKIRTYFANICRNKFEKLHLKKPNYSMPKMFLLNLNKDEDLGFLKS